MKKPIISIITICFENPEELESTLRSVQLHYLRDVLEMIVIDGSRNDDCSDIVKNYQWVDKYIHELDSGRFSAMNKGIALATGNYLIFMNSGDQIFERLNMKKLLNRLVDLQDKIFYGDNYMTFAGKRYLNCVLPEVNRKTFIFGNPPCHQSVLFPLKFCQDHGYDELLNVSADTKFMISAFESMAHEHLGQIISIFALGGVSNNPKSLLDAMKSWNERRIARDLSVLIYSPNLLKSIIKYLMVKIVGYEKYQLSRLSKTKIRLQEL